MFAASVEYMRSTALLHFTPIYYASRSEKARYRRTQHITENAKTSTLCSASVRFVSVQPAASNQYILLKRWQILVCVEMSLVYICRRVTDHHTGHGSVVNIAMWLRWVDDKYFVQLSTVVSGHSSQKKNNTFMLSFLFGLPREKQLGTPKKSFHSKRNSRKVHVAPRLIRSKSLSE